MHRVRTSLPYFQEFGWDAEVVCVDSVYTDIGHDELLTQSVPRDIKIHKVKALSKKWTSKLGLGSVALRALPYYLESVNELLRRQSYNLVYFSTTQFPVCILGAYWRKKFKVPYVIDMQDPWHSDYYLDKPKKQRPPKYWFSYRLNKYLEPKAMRKVDGLISVSDAYLAALKSRYPEINSVPAATITFGAFEPDIGIAKQNISGFPPLLQNGYVNIVYVGRGGMDMHRALTPVFKVLKKGLTGQPEIFSLIKFYFIGTSYAPAGKGQPTVLPLAEKLGVAGSVIELTDRISYYHSLATLLQADALFIPGSDDAGYTASKIYPYLLTRKPLLAVFNKNSSVVNVLDECASGANTYTFDAGAVADENKLYELLLKWGKQQFTPVTLKQGFQKYSAQTLTGGQTELFDLAIKRYTEGSKNR